MIVTIQFCRTLSLPLSLSLSQLVYLNKRSVDTHKAEKENETECRGDA